MCMMFFNGCKSKLGEGSFLYGNSGNKHPCSLSIPYVHHSQSSLLVYTGQPVDKGTHTFRSRISQSVVKPQSSRHVYKASKASCKVCVSPQMPTIQCLTNVLTGKYGKAHTVLGSGCRTKVCLTPDYASDTPPVWSCFSWTLLSFHRMPLRCRPISILISLHFLSQST